MWWYTSRFCPTKIEAHCTLLCSNLISSQQLPKMDYVIISCMLSKRVSAISKPFAWFIAAPFGDFFEITLRSSWIKYYFFVSRPQNILALSTSIFNLHLGLFIWHTHISKLDCEWGGKKTCMEQWRMKISHQKELEIFQSVYPILAGNYFWLNEYNNGELISVNMMFNW